MVIILRSTPGVHPFKISKIKILSHYFQSRTPGVGIDNFSIGRKPKLNSEILFFQESSAFRPQPHPIEIFHYFLIPISKSRIKTNYQNFYYFFFKREINFDVK